LETIHTIEWMKQMARQARAEGRLTGFVPTMGALHAGHMSLVHAALAKCQPVVASVFVNPTQFGPSEDFQKYPRTLESDGKKLEGAGVDYLFAPEASEIYPPGFRTWVNVEGLSERLEGRARPGHFRGVTTVVLKLLEIVQPQKAFFGRKDAQQARIIGQMAGDLHLDSEIVVCPIVREPDGLAMSSRNAYLSDTERRAATVLHRALEAAAAAIAGGERRGDEVRRILRQVVQAEPLARLEYAEVVDAESFQPVATLAGRVVLPIATHVGRTRLIDNFQLAVGERPGAGTTG
jgi:pantoate--beta-alanine ligase